MSFLFCTPLLLLATLACEIDFGTGIGVKWSVIEGETHIDIMVDAEIYTEYDWIGLGLKRYEDGTDMTKADYFTIIIERNVLVDNYSDANDAPIPDVLLGGVDDLLKGPVDKEGDDMRLYGFRRRVNTGDIFDVELVFGDHFYWQWAYGMVDAEGNLLMHDNQGYIDFILESCGEDAEIYEV